MYKGSCLCGAITFDVAGKLVYYIVVNDPFSQVQSG